MEESTVEGCWVVALLQEVIGWFRLRRQSTPVPSMRELAIHRSVQIWLESRQPRSTAAKRGDRRHGAVAGESTAVGGDGKALFLLCVANTSANRALHAFSHVFMTRTSLDRSAIYLYSSTTGVVGRPLEASRTIAFHLS